MPTITISSKFQVVIPRQVRQKLRLLCGQRLQVLEKDGVISLVPEVPLKSLKGAAKGVTSAGIREKKDRV
jgi:AbrB family looped-hinge helix DNA binding protein